MKTISLIIISILLLSCSTKGIVIYKYQTSEKKYSKRVLYREINDKFLIKEAIITRRGDNLIIIRTNKGDTVVKQVGLRKFNKLKINDSL